MKHPNPKKPETKAVKVTEELLNEIVRKIVENFKVEKIILFGSYAWGKPREWSDIDLLVILESKLHPRQRRIKIKDVCQPDFIPMDILAMTSEELQSRLDKKDWFYKKILKQGNVLYAA